MQKGRAIAQEAGLSVNDCLIHAVYGVKSRKRLKTNLGAPELEAIPNNTSRKVRLYKVQRRNGIQTATEVLN